MSIFKVDNTRDMYVKCFPAALPDLTSQTGKWDCVDIWVIASVDTKGIPTVEQFLTMESQWVNDPLADKVLVFNSPQNAIAYAQNFRDAKQETKPIPERSNTIIELD